MAVGGGLEKGDHGPIGLSVDMIKDNIRIT